MNAECRKMKVQEVHNNVVDFKQSVFFPFGSSSLDSMKEQLNIEAYAKAAAAAGYENAGTIEFLLDRNGDFYFMFDSVCFCVSFKYAIKAPAAQIISTSFSMP